MGSEWNGSREDLIVLALFVKKKITVGKVKLALLEEKEILVVKTDLALVRNFEREEVSNS